MIYLSPHRIKNFLKNDQLLDWLELYGKKAGFLPNTSSNQQSWQEWICQRGHLFEKKEMEMILTQKQFSIHQFSHPDNWEQSSTQAVQTLSSQKYDILLQTPICATTQPNLTWRGIIDILIHSRVIQKIPAFSHFQSNHQGYFIADWKQNRIQPTKKNKLPLQYKLWYFQCLIYRNLLSHHQIPVIPDCFGIIPQYILPDSPGGILHNAIITHFPPEYDKILSQAEEWFITLHQPDTQSWDPYSHPQLAPNGRNHTEHPFSHAKTIIGRVRGELTMIPHISVERKRKAIETLKRNDLRIDDQLLQPSHLGFKKENNISKRIRRSLHNLKEYPNSNQTFFDEVKRCFPEKTPFPENYVAIDFEFIPNAWIDNSKGHTLVCWGYLTYQNDKLDYQQYIIESPDKEEQLWIQFYTKMKEFDGKWISWGHVERNLIQKRFPELTGIDFIKEFHQYNFLPMPLIDYKLKNWGNYLTAQNLIPKWMPKIQSNLPEQGNFWIPQWIPFLKKEITEKPNTDLFLQYHLRDLIWLYTIYYQILQNK